MPWLWRDLAAHAQGDRTSHFDRSRRKSKQRLDQVAAAKTATKDARPGMRMAREFGGAVHVVTIGDAGQVFWNEREWRSLSEVARAITGTRWSGPAFFGLKEKRKAA